MLGSYGAKPDPQRKVVIDDTFPSGILARGVYDVQSKVIDDDKNVWLGESIFPIT
jgi:Rho GDP-dissociation inhibitor